jgi:hypothetical protein
LVKEIKAAPAWPGDALRLPLLHAFGGLAFFDCGGTWLSLMQRAESILYLLAADTRGARRELTARATEALNRWRFCKDPDGHAPAVMAGFKPEMQARSVTPLA